MKKITNLIFIIISLLLLVSCSAARVGDVFLVGVSDGLSDDAYPQPSMRPFLLSFQQMSLGIKVYHKLLR